MKEPDLVYIAEPVRHFAANLSTLDWQVVSEYYGILRPQKSTVTAPRVVAGIDRIMILSVYQSAEYNEAQYRRLRRSCRNKLLTISQLSSSS